MAAKVRVEQIDDGYDVVLQDDDQLVLAHYDAGDCDVCAGRHDSDQHARQDAERYAAQVRRFLDTAPGR
ncbi:MAG: hypothetical protein QOJ23_1959 [Actinomycetota bacterium]|jgi:hypothetical protein|nr:hypothetical protein [Actinomycetota bacterium]